ncbi:AraC family transcriptional regulator [Paenibacillus sepulcri]|uniref:AraC family transcriptional regulator n=1 Tax=Paenibacillus sepulcri TaxID=359917 RepID=A0ABS7BVB7_9BACL|nr:AraC family transcriptional regulator [Paenibacillus sepulcri]
MRNSRTWFYRSLFSYLPIFFVITSILFLLFFLAFSQYVKESTNKATQAFNVQIAQSVENLLKPVDKLIIKEIMTNDTIGQFFEDENSSYMIYQSIQALNNMIASYPIIDSIYVYRLSDQLVLTNNMFTHADTFADREFLLDQLETSSIVSWTGKRSYQDPRTFTTKDVVSLVRRVPIISGQQGLFVVNIRTNSIRDFTMNMSSLKINYVDFIDAQEQLIVSTEEGSTQVQDNPRNKVSLTHSPYLGWNVQSGLKQRHAFEFFSSFPYIWVTLGFLSIVAGSVFIVYVTRRNYKPIESIVGHINEIFVNKSSELLSRNNDDEMRFISTAIDKLLEQSVKLQSRVEEDQVSMRRHFFNELLDGTRQIGAEEWKLAMERLELNYEFKRAKVAVMEIDKYADFCSSYSERDQYLLKFVISSVLTELAEERRIRAWTQYIGSSRLGIVFLLEHAGENEQQIEEDSIEEACTAFIHWVTGHLKFTVTIGMGGTSDLVDDIPLLYEDAVEALKYKAVLGSSRIILSQEMPSKRRTDMFQPIQLIRTVTLSFKLGESEWEARFEELFHTIQISMISRDDVTNILHNLIYNLDREVMGLSESICDYWKKDSLPELNKLLDNLDTLEEFQASARLVLNMSFQEIGKLREHRSTHQIIHKVKQYVKDNYANPDLSLNQLSDEFNLSTRYLSRLFKDEFGEKFVDYLVRVRLEKAKELLRETKDPVHEVALKVGYIHAFSFIRMFKNNEGITPGDYRK